MEINDLKKPLSVPHIFYFCLSMSFIIGSLFGYHLGRRDIAPEHYLNGYNAGVTTSERNFAKTIESNGTVYLNDNAYSVVWFRRLHKKGD